jgi:hypothetical protein
MLRQLRLPVGLFVSNMGFHPYRFAGGAGCTLAKSSPAQRKSKKPPFSLQVVPLNTIGAIQSLSGIARSRWEMNLSMSAAKIFRHGLQEGL